MTKESDYQELERLRAAYHAANDEYFKHVKDDTLEGDLKEKALLIKSVVSKVAYNCALEQYFENHKGEL